MPYNQGNEADGKQDEEWNIEEAKRLLSQKPFPIV